MKDQCFLVVDETGIRRLTKTLPRMSQGEISVGITIDVPDELFKRPRLSATITVSPDAVQPIEIDAGQLEAISEHIRDGLGVEIDLQVVPAPTLEPA